MTAFCCRIPQMATAKTTMTTTATEFSRLTTLIHLPRLSPTASKPTVCLPSTAPTHINKHNGKLTRAISKNRITTTNLCCQCTPNQTAPKEQKLSDQVLFNFPIVRKTVFKACNAKTANVDTELVSQVQKHHQILDKQSTNPKQQRRIITQLQTIKIFCLLCCECHFLPQHMEDFANLNPDALVALQGDKHN